MLRTLELGHGRVGRQLLELQRAAYAREAELIRFDGIPTLHETLDALVAQPLTWLGAFDGDRLVGAIAWTVLTDGTVDIDRLFVDPEHVRRGHARDLVLAVLARGRRTIVSTGTANGPARQLYESLGFVATGRTEIARDVTTTQYARGAPYVHDGTLRDGLAANLAAHDRHAVDDVTRRAAVALTLVPVDGIPHFLFTQRAWTLRRGAGQYALPGGAIDPGEDAIDAAVRELHEELGVAVARHDALGCLDDFTTRTDHVVTPVVLWSDRAVTLTPAPDEVHEAWRVPLAELDHPDAPRVVAHPSGGAAIARMPVRGEWINPPTAAFLLQLRDVALHGRATRVHDVGQPDWTAT